MYPAVLLMYFISAAVILLFIDMPFYVVDEWEMYSFLVMDVWLTLLILHINLRYSIHYSCVYGIKRTVCICVFCRFFISYFQDGLKTIEHFGSYVADLSIKLQKIRQKQDEERRRLTELRTLLRSAPGLDKEVSHHMSQQSMYILCSYKFFFV
jgi:hypothetical protein